MNNYFYTILFFLINTSSSFCMEVTPITFPHDLVRYISNISSDTQNTTYPFHREEKKTDDQREIILAFSSTLPITKIVGTTSIATEGNTPQTNYLPYPHYQIAKNYCCSESPPWNPVCVNYNIGLYSNREQLNNCFFFPRSPYYGSELLFDGINTNNISIHAQTHTRASYIFLSKALNEKKLHYYNLNLHPRDEKPIIRVQGKITALTLEHEKDRIIYCLNDNSQNKIYIQNIVDRALTLVTSGTSTVEFKKIINIGNTYTGIAKNLGDIYLGLTSDGKLYTLWHDKNKVIRYAQQNSNNLSFLDISVDNTTKSPCGLKPKIALLSTTGNLYITYLTKYDKQILHKIHTIDEQDLKNVCRISYDNGMVGIIYTHPTIGLYHGKYELLQDNAEFAYAANVLAQDEFIYPNNDNSPTNETNEQKLSKQFAEIKKEQEILSLELFESEYLPEAKQSVESEQQQISPDEKNEPSLPSIQPSFWEKYKVHFGAALVFSWIFYNIYKTNR